MTIVATIPAMDDSTIEQEQLATAVVSTVVRPGAPRYDTVRLARILH